MAASIKMLLGMEIGIGPCHFVLDGDPAPPPQKGTEHAPNFRPMFIVANGWMDQHGTWHGGGPWSRLHCARWGRNSLSQKGAEPPQFSAHSYCGHTAGCIKIGMEIGLSPDDFVLDGDPARLPKKEGAPNFRPTSIVAKQLHGSRCHLVRR